MLASGPRYATISSGSPVALGFRYCALSVWTSFSALRRNVTWEKKSVVVSLVTSSNLIWNVAHLSASTCALTSSTAGLFRRRLAESSCAAVVKRYLMVMVPPPWASRVPSIRQPASVQRAATSTAHRTGCARLTA